MGFLRETVSRPVLAPATTCRLVVGSVSGSVDLGGALGAVFGSGTAGSGRWTARTWDSNRYDGLLTLTMDQIQDNFSAAVVSLV